MLLTIKKKLWIFLRQKHPKVLHVIPGLHGPDTTTGSDHGRGRVAGWTGLLGTAPNT